MKERDTGNHLNQRDGHGDQDRDRLMQDRLDDEQESRVDEDHAQSYSRHRAPGLHRVPVLLGALRDLVAHSRPRVRREPVLRHPAPQHHEHDPGHAQDQAHEYGNSCLNHRCPSLSVGVVEVLGSGEFFLHGTPARTHREPRVLTPEGRSTRIKVRPARAVQLVWSGFDTAAPLGDEGRDDEQAPQPGQAGDGRLREVEAPHRSVDPLMSWGA